MYKKQQTPITNTGEKKKQWVTWIGGKLNMCGKCLSSGAGKFAKLWHSMKQHPT